jgi:hypothetical protein
MDLDRRAAELAARVLAPLLLGGRVAPVRPLGAALALTLGERRAIADPELLERVRLARVRRARELAPVDALPDLGAHEWALTAALNDLLQATNHALAGGLRGDRRARLLASVQQVAARVPPPGDVGEALARHATFARAPELMRTDTRVTWWCGEATYRGALPPERLLRWRELRRVEVAETRVPLADMAEDEGALAGDFASALGAWLACSPLTDLATAGRRAPGFAWTTGGLALISVAPGRTLARRALARAPLEAAVSAIARALDVLDGATEAARAAAAAFLDELAARPGPLGGGGPREPGP